MNTGYRHIIKLGTILSVLALAGCLDSGSQSSSSFNDDPVSTPPPPGNSAPTISGNPPSAVTVGESYSFTPTASDADGDALTFSIENRPAWASFDASTGQLSGTPTLGDIGSFADVRISVSDGQASASMPSFAIDVVQSALASVTLTWTAPTMNDDGSTLTDLAGYNIYYGTSSGRYTNEIRIDNPSVTRYVVENLSPGTIYFAATAFNSTGSESRFSGEAVANVN